MQHCTATISYLLISNALYWPSLPNHSVLCAFGLLSYQECNLVTWKSTVAWQNYDYLHHLQWMYITITSRCRQQDSLDIINSKLKKFYRIHNCRFKTKITKYINPLSGPLQQIQNLTFKTTVSTCNMQLQLKQLVVSTDLAYIVLLHIKHLLLWI